MSDQHDETTSDEPKEQVARELSDEALDAVSGGNGEAAMNQIAPGG